VGPGGLFCISTKGWRGLVACGSDGRLTYNNEPTDLLRQTTGQAMQLRDRLRAMMGNDVPFVQAVLAVPLAFVACPRQQGPMLVVHQDELLDAIEGGSKKLAVSQIDRCAKVLDMPRQSAAHRYQKPQNAGDQPQKAS
jgi:hypothetical protein